MSSATVGGKRLSAGRGSLAVIRLRLANRQGRRLVVGAFTAVLASGKRSFDPILADGREVQQPVFADPSVAAGRAIAATVVYRTPKSALKKAELHVRDPLRHQRFELRLYRAQ